LIKDVLVHLDGTMEDDVRLAHAGRIARERSAHVIGLFTLMLPAFSALPNEPGGAAMVRYEADLRAQGAASLKRLRERYAQPDAMTEIRKIEGPPGRHRSRGRSRGPAR
jgi:hypothetical protein